MNHYISAHQRVTWNKNLMINPVCKRLTLFFLNLADVITQGSGNSMYCIVQNRGKKILCHPGYLQALNQMQINPLSSLKCLSRSVIKRKTSVPAETLAYRSKKEQPKFVQKYKCLRNAQRPQVEQRTGFGVIWRK